MEVSKSHKIRFPLLKWQRKWRFTCASLTLLQSEWPKLYGVLAILSAIELNVIVITSFYVNFSFISTEVL